jgi:hypothetical protein
VLARECRALAFPLKANMQELIHTKSDFNV